MERAFVSSALCVAASLAAIATATPAAAQEIPVSGAQIRTDAREYYAGERRVSYLFMGYGAITAGAGAVSLTESGDFAHGFGWSSLILGGLTTVGGAGYLTAVILRGNYYEGLADTDLQKFKVEESEHIAGTNSRFKLYLGFEITETLTGIGFATYGLAAKNDLWKGIGIGTALQGIGLFVLDVPGSAHASKYGDELRRFIPGIGVTVGGNGRPWAASLTQTF